MILSKFTFRDLNMMENTSLGALLPESNLLKAKVVRASIFLGFCGMCIREEGIKTESMHAYRLCDSHDGVIC